MKDSFIYRDVKIAITAQDSGSEALLALNEEEAFIWSPDNEQAITQAKMIIDRMHENEITLNAACFIVNSSAPMYPNELLEQFMEVELAGYEEINREKNNTDMLGPALGFLIAFLMTIVWLLV